MEKISLNAHLDVIKKESLEGSTTTMEYFEDDFAPNDSSLAQNALKDILWSCAYEVVENSNTQNIRAARVKVSMKGTNINYKEFTYNASPESLVRAFKTGVVENLNWKLDVSK